MALEIHGIFFTVYTAQTPNEELGALEVLVEPHLLQSVLVDEVNARLSSLPRRMSQLYFLQNTWASHWGINEVVVLNPLWVCLHWWWYWASSLYGIKWGTLKLSCQQMCILLFKYQEENASVVLNSFRLGNMTSDGCQVLGCHQGPPQIACQPQESCPNCHISQFRFQCQ